MAEKENIVSNTQLVNLACAVRKRAYAPYSKFAVGAALYAQSGEIFVGCNVENVSLGLTMCAEQAAVAAAVSAGQNNFTAIAIVADAAAPVMPCGRCRQILAEFNPAIEIIAATTAGEIETFRLTDLLPRSKQGILDSLVDVSTSK